MNTKPEELISWIDQHIARVMLIGAEELNHNPPPKEPKSHYHFMVDCLMEEITKYPRKFNEKSVEFIKNLSARFFNDPDYKLSKAQAEWLEALWTK